MVGSRFCELAQDNFNLTKADLSGKISVDITEETSVDDFFRKYNFSYAILFSAFTDVNGAEKQRNDKNGTCWQINVNGVKNIVSACAKFKRKLIFISTDFVFDGSAAPYAEEDQVGPNFDIVSWYGITKIEAEKLILSNLPESIVIRIAYPFRGPFTAKDDIAKRILRLYSQKKLYPVFADQTITPTFIDDLAGAITLLINKNKSGIFHVVSPLPTTQYEFAKVLVARFGFDSKDVKKGSLRELLKKDNVAPRPIQDILKAEKIASLGFITTNWREGIEIIYKQSRGQLI